MTKGGTDGNLVQVQPMGLILGKRVMDALGYMIILISGYVNEMEIPGKILAVLTRCAASYPLISHCQATVRKLLMPAPQIV
jgi:hypothetical protein